MQNVSLRFPDKQEINSIAPLQLPRGDSAVVRYHLLLTLFRASGFENRLVFSTNTNLDYTKFGDVNTSRQNDGSARHAVS